MKISTAEFGLICPYPVGRYVYSSVESKKVSQVSYTIRKIGESSFAVHLVVGRGIGFFDAGNFYPDFILWLLVGQKQYVTFIDPKGLRNIDGPEDPKIRFYRTIKGIEARLADPNVILNSFIVSNTPYKDISWWSGGISKADLEKCHVLFQKEDKHLYVEKLLSSVVGNNELSA